MTDVGEFDRDIRGFDGPRDRALLKLAQRQHGRVAHRQLRRLGFGSDAIQWRVRTGRLIRLFRGVYAVGHFVETARGNWMAAVLACGDEAVLSHRSGATLWGIIRSARRAIDVTTKRRGKGHPGITLHRTRALHPDDVTEVDGIPVTSVARTLLDLAEVVPPAQLRRAIEQAEKLELFDLNAIERLLDRSKGRHGVKALTVVLAENVVPEDARSELEHLLPTICRAAGLPIPAMNVMVAGRMVDAFFASQGVAVELDSHRWHRSRSELQNDSEAIVALQLAGYLVLRFTYRDLTMRPAYVASSIRRAVSHQPAVSRLSA